MRFGISKPYVSDGVHRLDVEDGERPGTSAVEAAELREARKRVCFLGQENEILHREAANLWAMCARGTWCRFLLSA